MSRSWGLYSTSAQGGASATDVYPLAVLGAGASAGPGSPTRPQGGDLPTSSSSRGLQASLGGGRVRPCLPLSSRGLSSVQTSLALGGVSRWIYSPPNPRRTSVYLSHVCEDPFPNKATFWGCRWGLPFRPTPVRRTARKDRGAPGGLPTAGAGLALVPQLRPCGSRPAVRAEGARGEQSVRYAPAAHPQ